ncbi:MAG: hypothetical protein HKN42_16625 [Granulosicoccus sp.]|nr:hypothetical protein [Granulosicoccus sp.]
MSLIIAVPRERRTSERRVALDPSRVERLLQQGLQVRIEAECGHAASFHDEDYRGVTVMHGFASVVQDADIVVKVVCPTLEEIALLPSRCVLICIMSAFQHLDEVQALRERRITVLAMDHLPRITRAQPMDALSSQATVAGYKAALLAAELSPRLFPMLTTAAGTIRPSRVLVIGAGVAGLQAIATSKRLGAQVEAYDIRRAAKEQIESVGARMIDTGVEVEGAGGVARALRKDERQKQHDVLAEHLARAHVVICAASIPGRQAPRIITEDMVDGMLPESVIVDMAASTGGNCELTRIGEHYYHQDTLIVGPLNLPSHGAVHASEMYSRNIYNMLQLIIQGHDVVLDPEDEIIARCVLLYDGQVNHASIASLLEVDEVPFGGGTHKPAELPDQTAGWLDDGGKSADETRPGETVQKAIAARPQQGSEDTEGPDSAGSVVATAESGSSRNQSETAKRPAAQDEVSAPRPLGAPDDQLDEDAIRDLAALEGVDAEEMVRQAEATDSTVDEDLPRDELIRIDGVGPALQERLYSFGYRRWQQLADMDDDAIEKLSIQLELGDEIKEQDWRGQAQRLVRSRP